VKEFQSELQELSKDKQVDSVSEISRLVLREIGDLENDLVATANDPRTRIFLQSDIPSSIAPQLLGRQKEKLNVQKLLNELDKFTSRSSTQENKTSPTAHIPVVPPAVVAEVEKRLAQLEKVVGLGQTPSIVVEESVGSFPDIWSGLKELDKKLSNLDPAKLESTQRRVKGLMADFSELEVLEHRLSLQKSTISASYQEKINGIWNAITRWDKSAQQLPTVIGRLQSLRGLHEESAQVLSRLQAIEQQQELIERTLRFDKDALAKFTTTFASNAKVMQDNISSIETRISMLNK